MFGCLALQSIFEKIDGYNKSFFGFNLVGAFANVKMWRKYILALTLGSLFAWMFFGFESTWNMVGVYVEGLPAFLVGQTSLAELGAKSAGFYGVGQHLSTVVIYGFCFLLVIAVIVEFFLTCVQDIDYIQNY